MPTDLLAELIADAQQIVLPPPRAVEPPSPAMPLEPLSIPESAATLVDGYAEYGA
jgi:hypothetical protein